MYISHLTSHIEQSSRTATYYYLPCIYACTICATYFAKQATHLGLPKREYLVKNEWSGSRWLIFTVTNVCIRNRYKNAREAKIKCKQTNRQLEKEILKWWCYRVQWKTLQTSFSLSSIILLTTDQCDQLKLSD